MHFYPAPPNDFCDFVDEYARRCRSAVPGLCAVAAKWDFEDLIPGLSDFDTRFIMEDGMTPARWQAMSLAVGRVHTDMARLFPRWHRNLEHLPGVNLTVTELTDPLLYYPEYTQWRFYDGDPVLLKHIETALNRRGWSARDEIYHLKKVATFFGPYQRGIDPAINLGPWENKYPLHSRFMHYFTPPVQAMVSLSLRRNVRGKLESLRLARSLFPQPQVIDLVFEAIERHYEWPELYPDPRCAQLEKTLEDYLSAAWLTLADKLSLVEPEPGDTRDAIKTRIATVPADPVEAFLSVIKFVRLIEGRLRFYAQEVEGFDSLWLIRNEVGRSGANFFTLPLACYAAARQWQDLTTEQILARLRGSVLSEAEVAGMQRFAAVAAMPIAIGEERAAALGVADQCGPVLISIEKLKDDLVGRVKRPE